MSRNKVRSFEDINLVDGLDEMLVSVNAANLIPLTTDEEIREKSKRKLPMLDRERAVTAEKSGRNSRMLRAHTNYEL